MFTTQTFTTQTPRKPTRSLVPGSALKSSSKASATKAKQPAFITSKANNLSNLSASDTFDAIVAHLTATFEGISKIPAQIKTKIAPHRTWISKRTAEKENGQLQKYQDEEKSPEDTSENLSNLQVIEAWRQIIAEEIRYNPAALLDTLKLTPDQQVRAYAHLEWLSIITADLYKSMNESLAAKQDEIREQLQDMQARNNVNEGLSAQVNQLEANLQQLNQASTETQRTNAQLQNQNVTLKGSLEQMTTQREQDQIDSKKQADDVQRYNDKRFENQENVHKTALATRDKDIDILSNLNADNERQISKLNDSIRELTESNRKSEAAVTEWQAMYKSTKEQLEAKQKREKEIEAEVESLSKKYVALSESTEALERNKRDIETQKNIQIANQSNDIEDLQHKILDSTSQLTDLRRSISSISDEKTTLQVEIEKIRSALHTKERAIQALEQQLANSKEQAKAEIEAISKRLNEEITGNMERYREDVATTTQRYTTELQRVNRTSQEAIQQASEERAELLTRLQNVETERARLMQYVSGGMQQQSTTAYPPQTPSIRRPHNVMPTRTPAPLLHRSLSVTSTPFDLANQRNQQPQPSTTTLGLFTPVPQTPSLNNDGKTTARKATNEQEFKTQLDKLLAQYSRFYSSEHVIILQKILYTSHYNPSVKAEHIPAAHLIEVDKLIELFCDTGNFAELKQGLEKLASASTDVAQPTEYARNILNSICTLNCNSLKVGSIANLLNTLYTIGDDNTTALLSKAALALNNKGTLKDFFDTTNKSTPELTSLINDIKNYLDTHPHNPKDQKNVASIIKLYLHYRNSKEIQVTPFMPENKRSRLVSIHKFITMYSEQVYANSTNNKAAPSMSK